jgi:amidase
VLEVTIVRLTPSRKIGWTRYPLAPNVIDPDRTARLPEREAEWAIDVAAETVLLVDPPPALAALSLALEPMIGCFGVAPADGEAISTSTPGHMVAIWIGAASDRGRSSGSR